MRAFVALLITGCAGNEDSVLGPGDTDTGDDDDDNVPTGPIRSDEGSLVVLSWLPSALDEEPETVVLGMFVESRRDYLNLAQCVGSESSFCARELPATPGAFVLVESLDPELVEELNTRDVGPKVTLGDWEADYLYDSATDLGYYFGVEQNVDLQGGKLGLTLGGEWGSYAGTDDISAPAPMELTSHDPMQFTEFFDVAPIPLRWESGGKGEVYLYVSTPVEQRLYWLEDTGVFDLDLAPLGPNDGATVDLIIGR